MELISEAEYRLIRKDSYSTIKQFNDNRRIYKREYVDWQKSRRTPSEDMIMGLLIDSILLGEDVDDKFVVSGKTGPTGQMAALVAVLYKKTLEFTTEDGIITRDFSALFEESFNEVAFNSKGEAIAFKGKKVEKVMESFIGSPEEEYYQELRKNTGKIVIDLASLEKAEKAVLLLRNHINTSNIINVESNKDIEVFNQLALFYEYNGLEIKMLMDRCIVNHAKKLVTPLDLKATHNVEDFHIPYLKYGYYIQNAIYWKGCTLQPEWEGYDVQPLKFICVDHNGYVHPLVNWTTMDDIDRAFEGFKVDGKRYKGVNQLVDEILWHKSMDVWDTNKEAFEKNGRVPLNIEYEQY